MKKIVSYLLRAMLRSNSFFAEKSQRAVDARIAAGLEKWVEDKGFCRSDQSLEDVAALFDVSAEALSFYCSAVMGERFSTMRKNLRLHEARRLIAENPREHLTKIAYSVGILDKGNFRKQFYGLFRCTPGEWREDCLRREGGKKR